MFFLLDYKLSVFLAIALHAVCFSPTSFKNLLILLLLSQPSKGLLQENLLSNWDGVAPTLDLSNCNRCPARGTTQHPPPLLAWELSSTTHSNRLCWPRSKDSHSLLQEDVEKWKYSRIRQVRNASFLVLHFFLIPKGTSEILKRTITDNPNHGTACFAMWTLAH